MKKNLYSPAETMMRQRLQQQLAADDAKFGNQWKRVGGKLERWSKGLYYAFSIYAVLVYLLNELILFAAKSAGEEAVSLERLHLFSNNAWLVHGLILLTLCAFILQICRQFTLSLVLQLLATCQSVPMKMEF